MPLNSESNIINQISRMSEDELKQEVDLEVYLISKAEDTDYLYLAKKEFFDPDNPKLLNWVKGNIKEELNRLKIKDEYDNEVFYIDDYNFELTKKDYIAKLRLD